MIVQAQLKREPRCSQSSTAELTRSTRTKYYLAAETPHYGDTAHELTRHQRTSHILEQKAIQEPKITDSGRIRTCAAEAI